jgi:23S rRNA pseudouridine2605 synthase
LRADSDATPGHSVPYVRLQKFLAEAGLGSRRHCETLIQAGKVSVNGQPVTLLGTKITPGTDRVTVAGKPVAVEPKVYIALNKPAGVLCTSRDTHGRARVHDLLPASLPRLFSVGRLDRDTEGLLLLTNDGTFSLRLTHPRYKMPKTYAVEVAEPLTEADRARLRAGVRSEGEWLRAQEVTGTTSLTVVLREGKKRQIRRMLDTIGHPVRKLTRLAIGPITLGNLKQGQWRYLTHEEVSALMRD